MNKIFYYFFICINIVVLAMCLVGCIDDSRIVNENLNRDEQNFREYRRVVFKPTSILPTFEIR